MDADSVMGVPTGLGGRQTSQDTPLQKVPDAAMLPIERGVSEAGACKAPPALFEATPASPKAASASKLANDSPTIEMVGAGKAMEREATKTS